MTIDIPERANRLNAAYKAEQTEYIKLCKMSAEAELLSRDDKEALYKLLSFSKSRLSKYARIGNNAFLLQSDKILTGAYSIDYEIAQLNEDEILKGFAQRVLHSDCSREAVLEFKASIRPKRHAPKKQRVVATVSVSTTASNEILEQIEKLLASARRLDGVKITKPENKLEKAENAYKGELQIRFRSDAKILCKTLAGSKLPADKVKVIDQTLISGSNTEIVQVLHTLGADPEALKRHALEVVTVPPIVLKRHTEEERKTWLTWQPAHSLKPFLEQKSGSATTPTAKAARTKKVSGG